MSLRTTSFNLLVDRRCVGAEVVIHLGVRGELRGRQRQHLIGGGNHAGLSLGTFYGHGHWSSGRPRPRLRRSPPSRCPAGRQPPR
jgi:hypothetical protein